MKITYEDRPDNVPALRLRVITADRTDKGVEVHSLQLVRGDQVMTNITPYEVKQIAQDYIDWIVRQ